MWRKQADAKPSPPFEPPAQSVPESLPLPLSSTPRSEPTSITRSITLKGEIAGREDLFLDGEMEGAIRLPEAMVTVGPNGRVTAEIEASEIVVEGSVNGALHGRQRVEIRRSGAVRGEVVTPRLVIEDGAQFNGRVDMARPEDARVARAAAATSGAEAFPIH